PETSRCTYKLNPGTSQFGVLPAVHRRGIGYAARVKADDVVVVLEIIGGGALDEILMIYRSTL
ncbi:hypothetical protein, partial [Bifidobacterium longum]|uniref:hypothetical protein n=1 Tax=Bifidobacterium longum TaxID=216816 RepID=UPI001A954D5C